MQEPPSISAIIQRSDNPDENLVIYAETLDPETVNERRKIIEWLNLIVCGDTVTCFPGA